MTMIRRRFQPLLLALILVPVAAAGRKAPPAAPEPDPVTSRVVVEKQLEAPASKPGGLSGPEARQVHKRYLDRMGVLLEVDRSGRTGNGS